MLSELKLSSNLQSYLQNQLEKLTEFASWSQQ